MPSTIKKDRKGELCDASASLIERWCRAGKMWRIDTGYKTLAALNDYATITFKTPATGVIYYNFAGLSKSGNEIVKSLIEGCTISGGTVTAPKNFNRNIPDSACLFTAIKVGLSTDATPTTITGGTEIFPDLAAGTAQGKSIPGEQSVLSGVLILKNNTVYALKLLAKGAATFAAYVGIAVVVE